MRDVWAFLKEGFRTFIEDDALSRGAAIAFYAITAFAPILYIAALLAGLVFGREAAGSAIAGEVGRLIGQGGSRLLQAAIYNSHYAGRTGVWRNAITFAILIITATGVFSEMRAALNVIWDAKPRRVSWWLVLRARLEGLLLVLALAFLLLISTLMAAAINAFGARIDEILPVGSAVAWVLNYSISIALVAALLAAIYRVLPDADVEWRDVLAGAIGTAVLINLGQYLIGLYLGSARISYRYGPAGSVIVLLTWLYFTTQMFLLGAVFTRVWSEHRGSKAARKAKVVRPDQAAI